MGTGYERSNEHTVKGVAVERSAVQFRTSFERLLPYIYILGLGRPLSLRVGAETRIDDCGSCDSTATTSKPAYSVGKDAQIVMSSVQQCCAFPILRI